MIHRRGAIYCAPSHQGTILGAMNRAPTATEMGVGVQFIAPHPIRAQYVGAMNRAPTATEMGVGAQFITRHPIRAQFWAR